MYTECNKYKKSNKVEFCLDDLLTVIVLNLLQLEI